MAGLPEKFDLKAISAAIKEFEDGGVEEIIETTNKIKREREKEMKRERDLLVLIFDKSIGSVYRTYRLMGSRMAVAAFMNETTLGDLKAGMNGIIIRALGSLRVALAMKGLTFAHDPRLSAMINDLSTAVLNTRKVAVEYVDKMGSGWNGKGSKAMLDDIEKSFNSVHGYLEQTVFPSFPETKHDLKKLEASVRDKFQEARKIAV